MDTNNMIGMKPKATPKDFFLWLGALAALGGSVFSFINIVFLSINYAFPDPLSYGGYSSYASGMTYSMAVLIVVLPVFLILMWLIRKDIMRDQSREDIWVRRWAIFFILFAASVTFVTDLVVLLYTFLNGEELTVRFVLKVLVVLLVSGGGFLHFLADLKGHWRQNRDKVKLIGGSVVVLAIVAIGVAFFIVGTPATQRAIRFDQTRVSDLQNIQWQLVSYYQSHQVLPKDLSQLTDQISGFVAPVDPVTHEKYGYAPGEGISFKLCANFTRESMDDSAYDSGLGRPIDATYPSMTDSWAHPKGQYCFERVIDPKRYPPLEKAVSKI